jgi:hypothetical protein
MKLRDVSSNSQLPTTDYANNYYGRRCAKDAVLTCNAVRADSKIEILVHRKGSTMVRMMKHLLLAFCCCVACLAVLITGCCFCGVRGSGVVKTESRDVAGFSWIGIESVGRVTVRQTGRESLTITAEDNLLPLINSRVSDGILYLDTAHHVDIRPTKPIELVVEVKRLEGLHSAGVGCVEAEGIQSQRLSVSASGVGSVAVTGCSDSLNLNLSGVGNYQGEHFQTKQATVETSGVGGAVVNVSEQLDATVSGVGSVEYIGSPHVRQFVSGLGRVKKRPP